MYVNPDILFVEISSIFKTYEPWTSLYPEISQIWVDLKVRSNFYSVRVEMVGTV